MPQGALRRLRRMIAGLLVLTVLLFSGPQPSVAVAAGAHRHDLKVAGLTVAGIGHGIAAPSPAGDHDQGLPCCVGGQCVAHACLLPAQRAKLPHLSRIAIAPLPSREALLAGILTAPSSPPPRATV
jgi:hypothetical protein